MHRNTPSPGAIPIPGGRKIPHVGGDLPAGDALPRRDVLRPAPRYERRRRALGLLAAMLCAALLLVCLLLWSDDDDPKDLHSSTLAGVRRTHGPVCLDLAVDYSGSMRSKAATRDAALAELQSFIQRNLRPEDVLASVAFTDSALLTLPPTQKSRLTGSAVSSGGPPDGSGTELEPALESLQRAYRQSRIECAAHALIVVTDVELADPPSALAARFTEMRLQRVYWAIPGRGDGSSPGIAGAPALRSVIARGFKDARGLSLLYGRALALLTGQRLVKA
ncbi:vWA domain-containing protein [Actinomadura luteofluorescens]|uniref:vWA domain-containing protein n=1 Tax=Actinomadura luteofluorescens TaxID=46163 RepID=UPI00348DC638